MSVSVDLLLQNMPAARTKTPGGYWAGVWRRLRRDPMTVAFALVLLAIAGMAIAAPLIAPADPYKTHAAPAAAAGRASASARH